MQDDGTYAKVESGYSVTDTSNINRFIAFKNPFRYRSYYYDFETNLYYLNSRYYDPQIGRFINADDISILFEGKDFFNGLNLYAYCGNNPIIHTDEKGMSWWSDLWGWVVNAVIAVASVTAIIVVALGIVSSGGLLGAVLLGAGIGALSSMAGSIIAQGGFSNADPWQVAKAAGIGAAIGAVTSIASWGFGTVLQNLGQQFGLALSNTTHISSGIKFGKIFSTAFLMKAGAVVGNIVGGLIGGTVSNYIANKLFGKDMTVDEIMNEGIIGEIPGWIINLFRWIVS